MSDATPILCKCGREPAVFPNLQSDPGFFIVHCKCGRKLISTEKGREAALKGWENLIADPTAPYVYSTNCSWSGPISRTGRTRGAVPMPCCPYCGAVLMQVDNIAQWRAGAEKHERNGHTNYVRFIKWKEDQNRCWPNLKQAATEFERVTGLKVILGPPGPVQPNPPR